jgi:hypothetical protein
MTTCPKDELRKIAPSILGLHQVQMHDGLDQLLTGDPIGERTLDVAGQFVRPVEREERDRDPSGSDLNQGNQKCLAEAGKGPDEARGQARSDVLFALFDFADGAASPFRRVS